MWHPNKHMGCPSTCFAQARSEQGSEAAKNYKKRKITPQIFKTAH